MYYQPLCYPYLTKPHLIASTPSPHHHQGLRSELRQFYFVSHVRSTISSGNNINVHKVVVFKNLMYHFHIFGKVLPSLYVSTIRSISENAKSDPESFVEKLGFCFLIISYPPFCIATILLYVD